ncbi:MAG: hypothetical protein HY795_04725 [Desulfovibrio sp.]|nr:hypothetical protein [Desulfovibrio sp.]MBI4960474.1 hypothetical protein [Desulfovibrio sp.]
MRVQSEELTLLAFDPPHMGIPQGAAYSAKVYGPDGRFVEFFLDVQEGIVSQAGFLTDIPFVGVLCASFWCQSALGADLKTVRALSPRNILARFPSGFPAPVATAELCVKTGREAVKAAEEQKS